MGNAHESVKAIAGKLDIRKKQDQHRRVIDCSLSHCYIDLTTETNEEDGVAVVLEKIVQL